MDAIKIVAVVLIVAGILGLAYGSFSFTKETHEAGKIVELGFSMNHNRQGLITTNQPVNVDAHRSSSEFKKRHFLS
jgi:hypothetical protein